MVEGEGELGAPAAHRLDRQGARDLDDAAAVSGQRSQGVLPELKGDDLSYTVKIVDGEMPATASDPSVFIDVIGMPLTPVSYAGVARRSYARAVMY